MNKYIDRFVILPLSQIAVLAVAIGVFYFFFYFDRGELLDAEIVNINKSISDEMEKKKRTEELVREQENITKKANRLSEEIKEFNEQIPLTLRHSDMISFLTSLCKDLNCVIAKKPEKKEDPDDKLPYFEKVKLDIKVEGRFPVLMKLMYTLVKNNQLYLINNLKMTRVDATKSDSRVALEGILVAFKQIPTEGGK